MSRFSLGERCLLGVIGPSGAGKSTLLGALTGMRAGHRGHDAVRRPRSVHAVRRAAAPHRPGAAGQHPAHPALGAPGPGVRRRAPLPAGHEQVRAQAADRRGPRRAVADPACRHQDLRSVRRPAEARQRRARAADQAIAAVPGRAHVRPRPRAGQVGHGDDVRAGSRRPHGHRRHSQRGQPESLRPPAGARARRQDRFLRAAAGWPAALREARLGRGVPGLRRRARPGLGRRLPSLAVLPALHRERDERLGRDRASACRRAGAAPVQEPAGSAEHDVPALPCGYLLGPGLPRHAGGNPDPAGAAHQGRALAAGTGRA